LPALPKKLATPASAAAALLFAFVMAYGGDAGHGFIKDDFRWIRETRTGSPAEAARLFERTDGFYRPIVSLSFAANSAAFGLEPRAYGLSNLALAGGCAAVLFVLARGLGLGAAPALVAAGAWAFNFHGVNMAVLWISGRTALLVTLFALLAAVAHVKRRPLLAGACCLLAMLSKEEAVLLPLVAAAWSALEAEDGVGARVRAAAARTWPWFVALGVYLPLRLRTDAFWPADAPSYYRLTVSPAMLAGNIVQYADRALTTAAVVGVVLFVASRRRARLDAMERRVVAFGAVWVAVTFAITVFVPTRSSLYAVLPSAGAALGAAAVAAAALRAHPRGAGRALVTLALLPALLLPVYWRRNERWVRLADVSARAIETVQQTGRRHPGRPIVLVDDPSERFNLDAAFGTLWPDAAALCLPGVNATLASTPAAADALVLRLAGGRLVQDR
jgi:hypothetical protein